jgi:hypothetical protein
MNVRNFLAVGLLAVGSLQMLGYLAGSKILRGLGLASGVAPFPKVFCAADGYEAFAASFALRGILEDGSTWSRSLDAEWYSKLQGPYNRRNVYGATLAFAPRLPVDLRQSLLREALRPGSSLRAELEIPEDVRDLKIVITPRPGETGSGGPWTFTSNDDKP